MGVVSPAWELMKTDCFSPCRPSSPALSSSGGTERMPPSKLLKEERGSEARLHDACCLHWGLRLLVDINLFCLSLANSVAQAVLQRHQVALAKLDELCPLAFGYSESLLPHFLSVVSPSLIPSPGRDFLILHPLGFLVIPSLSVHVCTRNSTQCLVFPHMHPGSPMTKVRDQGSCLISHA